MCLLAGLCEFNFTFNSRDKFVKQMERGRKYFDQVLRLSKAGYLHKDFMYVFAQIPVTTEITVVGIYARRSAVIVTRTQVNVSF